MSISFQTWICPTCKDDHYWPEGPYCYVVAALEAELARLREKVNNGRPLR